MIKKRGTCKDSFTGNSERRKKERKTKEEMGRQKKRWEDNIAEWTGLKLSEAIRHAEDREKWRDLVHRSSVAPQRQPLGIDERYMRYVLTNE